MRFLLFLFFFLATAHCNVLKDTMDYLKLNDPYEFTSPAEKVEMTLEDIFKQYPSLRVDDDDDLLELKKSFLEFINMKEKDRKEHLSGSSRDHKVLSDLLKKLTKYAREEFNNLTDAEQEHCVDVSGFVWYKLSTQASLKIIKKKKAYYEKKKMSREEIKMDVTMRSAKLFKSWYEDEKDMLQSLGRMAKQQELESEL